MRDIVEQEKNEKIKEKDNIFDIYENNLEHNSNEPIPRFTEINDDFLNNPLGFSNQIQNENDKLEENNNNNEKNNNLQNPGKPKSKEKKPSLKSLKSLNKPLETKNRFNYKIIFLGDSSVGKTSIINRYIKQLFFQNYECTLTAEQKQKTVIIDKDNIANLMIWDTAGEEKFRTITRQYYKDAHGAFLVYDITNRESFNKINYWIKDIYDSAPSDIIIFIIGNKSDMNNKREIFYEEGEQFSLDKNTFFLEVSAKNGNNIDIAFEKMAYKIFEKSQEEKDNENKVIRKEERNNFQLKNQQKSKKIKKKCCKL